MLLSRSRPGRAGPGSSNANGRSSINRPAGRGNRAPAPELPPYEPPAHPLSANARDSIVAMHSSREANRYKAQITKSLEYLKEAVYTINELLVERRTELAAAVEKRQSKGTEKTAAEVDMERDIDALEVEVATLTEQCEAAMRQTLDYQAELQDEEGVLELVQTAAAAQQPPADPQPPRRARRDRRSRPAGGAEEQEDDDDDDPSDEDMPDADAPPPVQGLPTLLAAARDAKAAEYAALSAQQRYAANNDYIEFKRTLHEAAHPEGEVNLAHAATWFDAQGRPNLRVAGARANGADDDDDDDLVIEREVRSFICELSLNPITEPYTSRVCNHTFQKSAVQEFMRNNGGQGHCPTCMPRRMLKASDFFDDDAYLRKMKRAMELAKRRQQVEEDEEEEAEDDVPDNSVVAGRSTAVKKERRARTQAADSDEE